MTKQLEQTKDTIDMLIWCGLNRRDFSVSSPFDTNVQGYLQTFIHFTTRCTLDKQLDVVIPLSYHFKVIVYWYDSDIKRVDALVDKPGLDVQVLDDTNDTSIADDVREYLLERYKGIVAHKLHILSKMYNGYL